LCGYEWQFNRMLCPNCEAEQGKKKDLIFVEGRSHEFADLCANCRKYIVGIDLREGKGESITPASAIGLVHLDILAQEKGYSPVAVCAWNMVGNA
jgi:FdhE protein